MLGILLDVGDIKLSKNWFGFCFYRVYSCNDNFNKGY